MKRKVKLMVIFALVNLSLGLVIAQPSESNAVVVSNVEDGVISKPVAEQLDSPVLNVGEDYVPRPTSKAINRMGAEEVIIVGGEDEVSPEVENKLENRFGSVTRISESNSIDTSISVSNEYWSEGSDKATIVQKESDGSGITASLLNSMRSGGGPVLMAKSGSLGNVVLSEVERLEAEEVTVYAHEPENVEQELRERGVEEVNIIHREDVGADFDERIGDGVQEVLVMPSDSEEGLKAIPSGSHTEGVVVDDRTEIDRLVDAAQENNVEKAVVVGDSPLARSAVVAFRTRTDIQVEKAYESSSATVEVAFEG